MKVYNHDIESLVKRLRKFNLELYKSVSSNLSELGFADKKRLDSYIVSIEKFKAWVVAQAELDLPESSPTEINLAPAAIYEEIENLDVASIMNLFKVLEVELVGSQSARKPSGLTSHDSHRFDTIVAKIKTFITDFVEGENLDLPESSPSALMTGLGNQGV